MTQTISEFDSNKENNFILGKEFTFRDKKSDWGEDKEIENDFQELFESDRGKRKQRNS